MLLWVPLPPTFPSCWLGRKIQVRERNEWSEIQDFFFFLIFPPLIWRNSTLERKKTQRVKKALKGLKSIPPPHTMHVSGVAVLLQDNTESQSCIFTKSPLFVPSHPKKFPLKIARGSALEILDIHSFSVSVPSSGTNPGIFSPSSLFFFLNQLEFLH